MKRIVTWQAWRDEGMRCGRRFQAWTFVALAAVALVIGCQATDSKPPEDSTRSETSASDSQGSSATPASGKGPDASTVEADLPDPGSSDDATTQASRETDSSEPDGSTPPDEATDDTATEPKDTAKETESSAPSTESTSQVTGIEPLDAGTSSEPLARLRQAIEKDEWKQAQNFLAELEDASSLYTNLIEQLADRDPALTPDAIRKLAALSPTPLQAPQFDTLGALLLRSLESGYAIDPFLNAEPIQSGQAGSDTTLNDAELARILLAANRPEDARPFLPSPAQVIKQEAVSLALPWAQYLQTTDDSPWSKRTRGQLWAFIQEQLKEEADGEDLAADTLHAALYLLALRAPEQRQKWGQAQVESRPALTQRLMSKLTTLLESDFLPASRRIGLLRLQQQLAAEIADAAESSASRPEWQTQALRKATEIWAKEANLTLARSSPDKTASITSPEVRRDDPLSDRRAVSAIEPAPLLECAPDTATTALSTSEKTRIQLLKARLYIEAGTPTQAASVIATAAQYAPQSANDLAHQLLSAWSTLVKDEHRMLERLRTTLDTLRSSSLGPLNNRRVLEAYKASINARNHPSAIPVDTIFGAPNDAAASLWGDVGLFLSQWITTQWQTEAVMASHSLPTTLSPGKRATLKADYEMLTSLMKACTDTYPDVWELHAVHGRAQAQQVLFNGLNRPSPQESPPSYEDALTSFERAAAYYQTDSPEEPPLFVDWLQTLAYAKGTIGPDNHPEPSTAPLLKQFSELSEEARNAHQSRLAHGLLDRLHATPPHTKQWMLQQALKLLKEHPDRKPIQQRLDRYTTLQDQVALHVAFEQPPDGNQEQALGLALGLRYTAQLARESGPFNRYLHSEDDLASQDLPRHPLEHFRDRLKVKLTERLQAHGLQPTALRFHKSDVPSHPLQKPGWREMPIAYAVVHPDPNSDSSIPPLEMHLGLPVPSGRIVLPATSPKLTIGAHSKSMPASAREPARRLHVAQILDARDWKDSHTATLKVEAKAHGLVPPLSALINNPGGTGLQIATNMLSATEKPPLQIRRLTTDSGRTVPITYREWRLPLTNASPRRPASKFAFAELQISPSSTDYRQWIDNRQVPVSSDEIVAGIPLVKPNYFPYLLVLGGLAVIILGLWLLTRRTEKQGAGWLGKSRYEFPSPVTPYTVLNLLERIETDSSVKLGEAQVSELRHTRQQIEETYFSNGSNHRSDTGIDLEKTAETWLERASRR